MTSPVSRSLVHLFVAMLAGVALAKLHFSPRACLGLAAALLLLAIAISRWRYVALLVALAAVMAAWTALRVNYVAPNDIRHWLTPQSQLAELTGHMVGQTFLTSAQKGAFGRFAFRPPGTLFEMQVRTAVINGKEQPVTGKLVVKIEQVDNSIKAGDHVRVKGWLAAIAGPRNPGEYDYRRMFAEYGIVGRLTLRSRGNLQLLQHAPRATWWGQMRAAVAEAADDSLAIGLSSRSEQLALMRTVLLGRRDVDLRGLDDSFRKVGLAHLLAISGAHLGILIGLTWFFIRLIIPNPPRAALLVLAVLILYLLAVPARVPIIRAGIMAATLCVGYATGRKLDGISLLSLAGIIVLIWRPMDLYSAGFQLSFGVVAALLLYARTVSLKLWPDPVVPTTDALRHDLTRLVIDFVSVNIVAFFAALPLIAYHFQIITPWAALLSLFSLPVVTLVLGLGYLKIALGLIVPTAGLMLAHPAAWATETLAGLVRHAAEVPFASVELSTAPSVLWTIGLTVFLIACLAGRFAGRRLAMVLSILLLVGWLVFPTLRLRVWQPNRDDTLTVNMFAVGNGSCFLVRTSSGLNLMFDCGSQEYLDVGARSIVPALRTLGVSRIDILFISHADLDHYGGCLDVMDRVSVGQVLVTPQLLIEAQRKQGSAAAYLIDQLRLRRMKIDTVSRGWTHSVDQTNLQIIWPTADFAARSANDMSIVLRVDDADRRLLLAGDIQQTAMEQLFDLEVDLKADICDLPHHGSFVALSPRWLNAVSPQIVLQSCGPSRLYFDKWRETIDRMNVVRLITAESGMVEVSLQRDGQIDHTEFK